MYVVIRRYTGVIDPKEIIRRVREEFLPIISKVEGYRGYHLVDTGTEPQPGHPPDLVGQETRDHQDQQLLGASEELAHARSRHQCTP